MNKILFAFLLIPAVLKSQPYIGASLGTYKVVTKEFEAKTYVLGIHAGYALSIFFVEGEERIDLITRNTSNNYFGFKGGINVPFGNLSVSPFVGYYYNYVSADNSYLNESYKAYGLRFNYKLRKSTIYAEGINMNNNQVTLGFSYKISSENN